MKNEMTLAQAIEIAHTLSDPSKMPGKSYSLPTSACQTGSVLKEIEGSVCSKCYADERGNYRFTNVKQALEKRLASITNPLWVPAMVRLIMGEEWFRWHDSGDVQGVQHLHHIVTVAVELPQTNFWLPLKERGMVTKWMRRSERTGFPDNLSVRLSMPMIEQAPSIGALEGKRDMNFSMVTRMSEEDLRESFRHRYSQGDFFYCEARKRDNHCGYCRACWDTSIPVIVYPFH